MRPSRGGHLSAGRRRGLWALAWLDALLLVLVFLAALARDFGALAVVLPTRLLVFGLVTASLAWWATTTRRGWGSVLAAAAFAPLGALRELARMSRPPHSG